MSDGGQARELLLGNEAIARGALEAGVAFCTGYPGNPSSEIIDTLMRQARDLPVHVEWSVNEIVAAEAAAGAAFTQLRALTTMKQNGLNVCSDFLSPLALTGLGGGALLVVVCDDPGPLTSSNEEDPRPFAQLLDMPLLEPGTPQEAKELTRLGLELSQTWDVPVMLRSVTRLSHCRAGVALDPLPDATPRPVFAPTRPLQGQPFLVARNRRALKEKLRAIRPALYGVRLSDGLPLDRYSGPERPELVLVASGLARLYAEEALAALGLEERVGILGLRAPWPFPTAAVLNVLRRSGRVLVLEQTEPFVEGHLKVVHSENVAELGAMDIRGRSTGDVAETGS